LDLCKEVFQVDQLLAGHIPVNDNCCRFDYSTLERALKNIIKDKLGDENCPMNAIPKTVVTSCPTFVVAQTAHDASARPTVFRTYSGTQIQASECAIWQAARATSAAPTFFKPMIIERPTPAITYIDGGLGHNNPSEVALDEARKLWPGSSQFGFVSIGTGRPKANPIPLNEREGDDTGADSENSIPDDTTLYVPKIVRQEWNSVENSRAGLSALIKMSDALAQLATNSEDIHQRMRRRTRFNDGTQIPYFRFNAPRDVGEIGLGDWNRSDELSSHTSNYMKEDEAEELRGLCVKFLLSPLSRK
jgi:hypothetical protein